MSYNVIVRSSIYNFGSNSYKRLNEELEKVKNPKYHWDEGDLVIEEDFDMRHIEAVLMARDRAWEEYFATDLNEKQKERVKKAIEQLPVHHPTRAAQIKDLIHWGTMEELKEAGYEDFCYRYEDVQNMLKRLIS